jgi:sialate O-acetylesterase
MPETGIQLSPYMPSALYNAMIAPLLPYAIKGGIWYQGESNIGRGRQYRTLFPSMIRSWREQWGQGDFPFYYVQIAPFNYGETIPSNTAELREAQLLTMQTENTGMVVTMDIGNPDNIHPGNKQEVGKRLSLWALARTYGREGLVCSGPVFSKMDVAGNKAIIHFTHTGEGLYCPDKELTHFELAGPDLKFFAASAFIDQNTVVVQSPKVKEPKIVRYGWSDKAEPNLFNREGLPASPFRSAEW